MKCPNCGKLIVGKANFCPHCGYKDETGAMSGKNKGPKAPMTPEKKKKLKLGIIIGSAALAVLIVVIVLAVTLSSIFRVAKVKKVELNMTSAQVEKLLGKPDEEMNAYSSNLDAVAHVYVYYENKVKSIIKKLNKLDDADIEDFDDLVKAMEQAEKLVEKLEKQKYKSIVVAFDSEGLVAEVAFNKNTKYDENDPYASWSEKSIKKFSLSQNRFYVGESFRGDLNYVAEYSDGSYRKSKLYAPGDFSTSVEGTQTITINDGWALKKVPVEVKEANVLVESSNSSWGRVSGTGYYGEGETVRLVATPNNNYTFVGWYDGEMLVSSDNPYEFRHNGGECCFKGRFKIEDYSKAEGFSDFEIEETSGGIAVVGLKNTSLSSVVIPEGVTSIGKYAFDRCAGLTSITFKGTKAQWKAISRGTDWKRSTGSFTVYCTDGNISKDNA